MLNVVDVVDLAEIRDVHGLGLLLPVPGLEKNSVLLEPRDGREVVRSTASAVEFVVAGRTAFRDRKIDMSVLTTDARVALACSKYDKGARWLFVGGGDAWAFDALFNGAAQLRAAARSRGKMLVGQVRYPWLQRVGFSFSGDRRSGGNLFLDTTAGPGGAMQLKVALAPQSPACDVAVEVARRAARYRLVSERLDSEAKRWLEQLATADASGASVADRHATRYFHFPKAKHVDLESARLAPDNIEGVL